MIIALLLQAPVIEAKPFIPVEQVRMLDEVIVTARRTETPVEEVPGSVEALDRATVNQPGLFRASDLAGLSAIPVSPSISTRPLSLHRSPRTSRCSTCPGLKF